MKYKALDENCESKMNEGLSQEEEEHCQIGLKDANGPSLIQPIKVVANMRERMKTSDMI